MHLETKLDMPMVIRWEPVLRAPFGNVNRLSPVHRWPNHLFRSTASIKWSEDSVSHLFTTIQRVFPYTGGYSRKVSSGSETSVTRLYPKRQGTLPFITALRYFISLTCSKVGVSSGPSTWRTSSRNRRKTGGLSASIATANVRVDAVYKAP